MRQGRSYVAAAIALGLLSLSGCAAESPEPEVTGDWGDPNKHPELGGAFNSLTAMAGTCAWTGEKGTPPAALSVVIDDTAQTVVLGVRAVDSQILVNGKVCPGTLGATTKNLKNLDISIKTSGTPAVVGAVNSQAVVLDFLGGVFAPGVKDKPGITINLGANSGDTLAIRGSQKADAFLVCAPASDVTPIGFNGDGFPDIAVKNAVDDKMLFSLAAGADTFNAQGGDAKAACTGIYTGAVSVFGGDDKDTIDGASGADTLNGGADDDVINGHLGNDKMYGEAGNDIFNMNEVADGMDLVSCGDGATDKVAYDLRNANIKVTIGTPDAVGVDGTPGTSDDVPVPNDGDVAANENDHVLSGCENIVGGKKDDILIGDAAANALTGGAGNDTLQGMAGSDTFVGGDGTDLVDYSEKTTAIKVTMDGAAADDGEIASGGEKDSVSVDIENVKGGSGADELIGNDANNEFWGAGGDDKLTGGKGDDVFHEGVEVTAGPDGILGGDGAADDITSGADSIDGGDGTDVVDYSERTSAVSVTLDYALLVHATGGDGTATYTAADPGGSPPVVESWSGTEHDNVWKTVENVMGGAGNDEIAGDLVAPVSPAVGINNELEGNGGNDKISGGYGDDTLSGSAGDDTLYGGAGDDTIEGGSGTNKVDCGAGGDIAYSATELNPAVVTCEVLI